MRESLYQKTILTLALLSLWASLKFILNYDQFFGRVEALTYLTIDYAATVALFAGLLFGLLAVWKAVRSAGIWPLGSSRRESLRQLFIDLGELSGHTNCEKFLTDTCMMISDYLIPLKFSLARINTNNREECIGSYSIQYGLYPARVYKPADFSLLENQAEWPGSKHHLDRRLEFSDGYLNRYSARFHIHQMQERLLDENACQVLETIINQKLELIRTEEDLGSRLRSSQRENKLYSMVSNSADITHFLEQSFEIVRERFDCDYFSVAVLDATVQNMYRHTYAKVGGMLKERGICYPLTRTMTRLAATQGKLFRAGTLDANFYRDDYHLYKSGFSTRLLYPLTSVDDTVLGVLTLAAVQEHALDNIIEEDLQFMHGPLVSLINYHGVNDLMKTLRRQIIASFNLAFGLEEQGISGNFYDQSARILAETLPATLCRIWKYDQKQNRLKSLGFHSLHKDGNKDSNESYELELMPRHKAALEMGKAIIVNQNNPAFNMDPGELNALGSNRVKSAILTPMKIKDRIKGMIAVGEARNWERRSLGHQEMLYSQIISTISALVLELVDKQDLLKENSVKMDEFSRYAQLYETYSQLPKELSSPLSAIQGAAEIISRRVPPEADLSRYNQIILGSAQNIIEKVNKFQAVKENILNQV